MQAPVDINMKTSTSSHLLKLIEQRIADRSLKDAEHFVFQLDGNAKLVVV